MFKKEAFGGISLSVGRDGEPIVGEDPSDRLGHGTAIYATIRKALPDAELFVFALFHESFENDEVSLVLALEYVRDNIPCDIVNLSLGIVECCQRERLPTLCSDIAEKGTVIVSAFDNAGAVSYPAASDSVVGVDSGFQCNRAHEYEYVEGSIVTVRGKGGNQRLAWLRPDYIFASGSSYAAAHMTGQIARIMDNGHIATFGRNQKSLREARELMGNGLKERRSIRGHRRRGEKLIHNRLSAG